MHHYLHMSCLQLYFLFVLDLFVPLVDDELYLETVGRDR